MAWGGKAARAGGYGGGDAAWGGGGGGWGESPAWGYGPAGAGGKAAYGGARGGAEPYGSYGRASGGSRAASSAPGRGSRGDEARSEGGMSSEKERLVQITKDIQRNNDGGRDYWETFCDLARTGNRDPAKHTVNCLRIFVEAWERGDTAEQAVELLRDGDDERVLRLRGVPFQSDVLDVVTFLDGYEIEEHMVSLGRNADGRATGEAYVVFNTPALANEALEKLQRQEIRGRYIELFKSSLEDKEENDRLAKPLGSGNQEKDDLVSRVKLIQRSSTEGRAEWEKYVAQLQTGSHDPLRQPTEALKAFLEAYHRGETPEAEPVAASPYVRMRGVPFQSTVQDVVEFLADYAVDEAQVLLGRNKDGRSTGEAYAAFPSTDDAVSAMEELQRKEISGRYIELFRSCQEEFEHIKHVNDSLRAAVASGSQGGDERQGHAVSSDSGPRYGGGMAEDDKEDLVQRVKTIQRGDPTGKQAWYDFCDALRAGNRDPSRHSKDSMRNFLQAYESGGSMQEAAMKGSGDGRVLRLRGVPYQCGAMEVVDFLADFGVDESAVTMGRGPKGKPNGEAYVVFPNRDSAEQAMEEKQKQEIDGRYIELFRSSHEEMELAAFADLSGSSGGGRRSSGGAGAEQRLPLSRDSAILKLRGLPFKCEVFDVIDFLAGFAVDASQVVFGVKDDGRSTGEAFVALPTPEAARAICKAKHKEMMGSRYVEVIDSSYREMMRETNGREPEGMMETSWGGGAGWHGAKGGKGGGDFDHPGAKGGWGPGCGEGWDAYGWGKGPAWGCDPYGKGGCAGCKGADYGCKGDYGCMKGGDYGCMKGGDYGYGKGGDYGCGKGGDYGCGKGGDYGCGKGAYGAGRDDYGCGRGDYGMGKGYDRAEPYGSGPMGDMGKGGWDDGKGFGWGGGKGCGWDDGKGGKGWGEAPGPAAGCKGWDYYGGKGMEGKGWGGDPERMRGGRDDYAGDYGGRGGSMRESDRGGRGREDYRRDRSRERSRDRGYDRRGGREDHRGDYGRSGGGDRRRDYNDRR
eukprot:TRINITY_DN63078_c0_g1_i1.p1 TRINITY_DN63078_c0_g1~~TRINITY_DN63078_c0_g1_i1.p1  ORF type:complete len:1023 (+),score=238.90 TRINITY_DN63078_c0_g1_i1:90-3158(+)